MPRQPVNALFTAADYAVFGAMLLLSLLIGIFYAIKDKNSADGIDGYLLGSRKMNYVAVAVSLSLSFLSAVTILGIPAEIYLFGSMYYWTILVVFMIGPVCSEIYIPIFYKLQLTSSFEYLQLRFSYGVRLLATAAYIVQNIMFIGVMIYAPAIALEAVTGFNLWAAIFTIGIICTIYTTLGGLKAVIWTDVFQGLVVLIGMLMTTFTAASKAGGWSNVIEKCWHGERMDFLRFDFDPRYRHTVWSLAIGLGIMWTSVFATSQSQVQRYLCCPTEADAKKSLVLSLVTIVFLVTLSFLAGLAMYAYFQHDCDPIRNGEVTRPDQLLPYLVVIIFEGYHGLPGLFVAGVFAGCLSTVSSGINSMACVSVQDFIRPFVKWRETTLTWWSKGLVFLYGLLCTGFACLSTLLGNVLQTSLSTLAIVGGPLLGLFTLGIIFPCGDSYGATFGLLSGIAFSSWLYIGSQRYRLPLTSPYYRLKPANTTGCIPRNLTQTIDTGGGFFETTTFMSNASTATVLSDFSGSGGDIFTFEATTMLSNADIPTPAIAELYNVSYGYLSAIGFAVTLILGLLISMVTSYLWRTSTTDPMLVMPIFDHKIFCFLPKSCRRVLWCGVPRSTANTELIRWNGEKKLSISHTNQVDVIRREEHENEGYAGSEEQSTRI